MVLRRHPEQGHGAAAPTGQRLGPADAGGSLGQREERPRSEAALLARYDDQSRRVGKSFGQAGGTGMAVALVGLGQGPGDRRAVGWRLLRRPDLTLVARQHEAQRLEQVEVLAVQEAPRQIAQQPAGAEVWAGRAGRRTFHGVILGAGACAASGGVESAA